MLDLWNVLRPQPLALLGGYVLGDPISIFTDPVEFSINHKILFAGVER